MYPVVYCRWLSTAGCSKRRGEHEAYAWLIKDTPPLIVISIIKVRGKYRQAVTIPRANIRELKYV